MQIDNDKLLKEAKWVILMFDQANTGGAIERMNRGKYLKDCVEDLRKVMVDAGIDPYDVEGGCWVERGASPPTHRLV